MARNTLNDIESDLATTSHSNWRRYIGGASSMAAVLALAACAAPPANAEIPQGEMARLQHACAEAMGLDPSETDYGMCTRSLRASVAGMDRPQRVSQERAACLARGLQPGTSAFALCVVDQTPPSRN